MASARKSILRKRRSAQAMDGKTSMQRESFHAILEAALPKQLPSGLLPWRPRIHPVIFVHRVEGCFAAAMMAEF
jgi:hypothetical protein